MPLIMIGGMWKKNLYNYHDLGNSHVLCVQRLQHIATFKVRCHLRARPSTVRVFFLTETLHIVLLYSTLLVPIDLYGRK